MKKQDIRNAYTQKVTELLNQGYTIFPDTMNGSQGEIAHIDLTNGSEILRVLLERGTSWGHEENDYCGDTVCLTVGRAAPDTRVNNNWDGIIWNSRLETLSEIKWAQISSRGEGWYTSLEEGRRISRLQFERYKAHDRGRTKDVSDALKCAALAWLRKQPRMKSCRLEDITRMTRHIRKDGKQSYEIIAKGKRYTIR